MAINYTQAFNAGEISRKMDGRNDLEVYKTGCRDLDNFLVLPQGGVERRAGTEFVQFAGTDGTNPARMIEFDFSSDIRFVIEIGTSYAKVHYTNSGGDQVVDVTGTVPAYSQAELRSLQFNRKYDTLILTCATQETQVLKRATILPTFTIEPISYVYPPLMEKNITSTTIDLSTLSVAISSASLTSNVVTVNTSSVHNSVTGDYVEIANLTGGTSPNGTHQITKVDNDTFTFPLTGADHTYGVGSSPTATNPFSGTTTITASADLFDAGHVGSSWGIDHIRAADKKEISDTRTTDGEDANSLSLDASFSNWSFETDDTWNGSVVIQRSIDGSNYVDYVVIGDTTGGVSRNFKYASSVPEGANTQLRVKWILATPAGSFKFSLEAENIYHKGVIKITDVTNATTATANIVSMVEGGVADPAATIHWSEAAFSNFRGFCPASEFFENRLWMAGSKDQPADIFASVFGEIFNFLSGTLSTDGIKRTIDSPEEPKWLESKRYLFLGTAGTAVSIRSADKDSLITQNNITTLVENAYGSAALQAEVANDVIVYVQRDGLKLRELIYAQGEDTFVGNDLNLISEDITDSGIVEMFVQKQPNQFIWCIKENGDACVLTYERGQQVRGWARVNTDGKFFSAAAIHDSGEDIVWACIERNGKYCIEKFHPRQDLNWYVDSGVQYFFDPNGSARTTDIPCLSGFQSFVTFTGESTTDAQTFVFETNINVGSNIPDGDDLAGQTGGSGTGRSWIRTASNGSLNTFIGGGGPTEIAPAGTIKVNTTHNIKLAVSHLQDTVACYVDGICTGIISKVYETATGNFQLKRGHSGTSTIANLKMSQSSLYKRTNNVIDLIVVAGQSNAEGQTGVNPPSDLDFASIHRFAYDFIATNATNVNLDHVGFRWGAELSMAKSIFNDDGRTVAVLKVTKGSTTLANQWNKNGDNPEMYNAFKTKYEAFKTALESTDGYTYSGGRITFVWIHGESDSNTESSANNYLTNFDAMLSNWNSDITGGFDPDAIYITETPLKNGAERTYQSTVEAAKVTIGNRTNNKYFTTNDLSIRSDDGTHYDSDGLRTLGERLATQWLTENSYPKDYNFLAPLQEGSGTTAYDTSPANNDGTITDAEFSTIDGVTSWNEQYGYTLDGLVKVPALLDLSAAANGQAIQFIGRLSKSSTGVTEVTGLDHLNGKTVQVIVDGSFLKTKVVADNKITIDSPSNNILVGLPYISTLRPMPIEPSLYQKLSQSRVKAIAKIIVRFFKTKGAKVGEAGRQLTTFPAVDTQDPTGQVIELKTGQQRFFVGSDYEREKLIEVRQDLPYPMTVLSIASHVNAEGA